MEKIIKMSDIDCANCAAKIEREVSKIEGVSAASVNFMSQKIVIDTENEKFDAAMEDIKKIAKKYGASVL